MNSHFIGSANLISIFQKMDINFLGRKNGYYFAKRKTAIFTRRQETARVGVAWSSDEGATAFTEIGKF